MILSHYALIPVENSPLTQFLELIHDSSMLVVATSGTGYILGSGNAVDFAGMCWTCAGTMMVAASANSLNQVLFGEIIFGYVHVAKQIATFNTVLFCLC